MINYIWRRIPILFGLIFCLLAVAVADEAASNRHAKSRPDSPKTSATLHERHEKSAGKHYKRHSIGGRHAPMKPANRERHHRNIERFRTIMTAELAKMPALNRRMERLGEIQKRRYKLQQLRQAAAAQTTTSRDKVVKRFHTLLREDQELSDKARHVASDIVKDMPRIQKQLDARRAELSEALEKTTATATTSGTEESKTASDLRRRLRYLNYIQDKLDDIKKHPERLDLLSRVLKGLPPDEDRWLWGRKDDEKDPAKRKPKADRPKDNRSDKAQLESLQKRRRDLQRQLQEIDNKIENLDDN